MVSGQLINFDKSSLQFGHKVPESIRSEVKAQLGITKIGGMGNYLGIPESLGGSKVQVFGYVNERINQKINSWTFRFFTKGGKDILIKSVTDAMPNYVMSCYRLPKAITKKITGAVSHFWWGGSGNKKGMHWLSWDKVCKSKDEGGLSFRDLQNINTSLLAKQLWRLIDRPDCLFSKVFKGRYFRNTDPLDPHRSYSPSYDWRSNCSARSLVKKWLIKRVGNGKSISVWTDPWLSAPRLRSATPKNHFQAMPNLTVDFFIDPTTSSWKVDLLNEYIQMDDIQLIKGLAISRYSRYDSLGWTFTDTGRYTVKSGYKIESTIPEKGLQDVSYGPYLTVLLSYSWKLKCPPKLRHFIWQAIKGILPVTRNLRSRGIACDIRCSLCGAEEESINHVLFECPSVLQVWALSKIPSAPDFFPGLSFFSNMDYLFWRLPKEFNYDYFPWILWYIWKNRNNKIYTNRAGNPQEILRIAEVEAEVWADAQKMEPERNRGLAPSADWLAVETSPICFIDVAWRAQDKFSGQGWLCRKNGSTEKMMGAMNLRRSLSALHAECEALIWAMECMKTIDYSDVVFATDCSQLVKMVSSPGVWSAFTTHLEEFQRSKCFFPTFKIQYISRAHNLVADKLVRGASRSPSAMFYVDSMSPVWFFELEEHRA